MVKLNLKIIFKQVIFKQVFLKSIIHEITISSILSFFIRSQ